MDMVFGAHMICERLEVEKSIYGFEAVNGRQVTRVPV